MLDLSLWSLTPLVTEFETNSVYFTFFPIPKAANIVDSSFLTEFTEFEVEEELLFAPLICAKLEYLIGVMRLGVDSTTDVKGI